MGSEAKLHPAGLLVGRPLLAGVAEIRRRVPAGGLAGASVLGARLLGAALAYATQVLAARLLGQDGFGIYALALVWLTLLGHFATFGTNQAVCRYVAQALATGDLPAIRGLLRFGALFVVAAGALVAGAAWLVVAVMPSVAESYGWPILLAVLAVPLIALQDNLEAVARAFDRPILGIAPAYLVRHGAALGLFGAVALSGVAPSPALAVAVAVTGLAIGVAAQVALLLPAIRRRVPPGPRRYDVRNWLRTALPVALVDGTETLLLNADILIVGLFCPPELVAAYFAVTRVTQLLDLLRYAASAVTAQRFAALAATGRTTELHRLIGAATLGTTGLSLAGAIVITLLGPTLLGLFGADFAHAAGLIPILAGGLVLSALLGPGEDVLAMLGEERLCAAIFGLALVVSLGLGLALIPTYGLVGAAIATVAATTLRSSLLALAAYRRLGIVIPFGLSWRQVREA